MNIFWMQMLGFSALILRSAVCCTVVDYCELSVHMLYIFDSNDVQNRLQQVKELHALRVVTSLFSPLLSGLVLA